MACGTCKFWKFEWSKRRFFNNLQYESGGQASLNPPFYKLLYHYHQSMCQFHALIRHILSLFVTIFAHLRPQYHLSILSLFVTVFAHLRPHYRHLSIICDVQLQSLQRNIDICQCHALILHNLLIFLTDFANLGFLIYSFRVFAVSLTLDREELGCSLRSHPRLLHSKKFLQRYGYFYPNNVT